MQTLEGLTCLQYHSNHEQPLSSGLYFIYLEFKCATHEEDGLVAVDFYELFSGPLTIVSLGSSFLASGKKKKKGKTKKQTFLNQNGIDPVDRNPFFVTRYRIKFAMVTTSNFLMKDYYSPLLTIPLS